MAPDPRAQIDQAVAILDGVVGQAVLGTYLYGSAVAGGLRPNSDLDLFVVTARMVTDIERRELIDRLTPISSRRLRSAGWRPIELTIVVESDVRPWRYPARMDFQYGEWLRDEYDAGELGQGSFLSPDLAVLVSMVREVAVPLRGPGPANLLDPVPHADVVAAIKDSLAGLMSDLEGDTTNVLLTLARMWSTAAGESFMSKDAAATWALERMPPKSRSALELARSDYLDGVLPDWPAHMAAAQADAEHLAERIRAA